MLFINGEDLMRKGRNQNTLELAHAKELYQAYIGFADVDGRARVVDLAEIERNGFNLNIPLYVAPARSPSRGSRSTTRRAALAACSSPLRPK